MSVGAVAERIDRTAVGTGILAAAGARTDRMAAALAGGETAGVRLGPAGRRLTPFHTRR